MRENSKVHYTFEDESGSAETFDLLNFHKIVAREEVLGTISVKLDEEDGFMEVPLLKGYEKPFDDSYTDHFGTEHHIYYVEEKNKKEDQDEI